jgi:hypothetical protein
MITPGIIALLYDLLDEELTTGKITFPEEQI